MHWRGIQFREFTINYNLIVLSYVNNLLINIQEFYYLFKIILVIGIYHISVVIDKIIT